MHSQYMDILWCSNTFWPVRVLVHLINLRLLDIALNDSTNITSGSRKLR